MRVIIPRIPRIKRALSSGSHFPPANCTISHRELSAARKLQGRSGYQRSVARTSIDRARKQAPVNDFPPARSHTRFYLGRGLSPRISLTHVNGPASIARKLRPGRNFDARPQSESAIAIRDRAILSRETRKVDTEPLAI